MNLNVLALKRLNNSKNCYLCIKKKKIFNSLSQFLVSFYLLLWLLSLGYLSAGSTVNLVVDWPGPESHDTEPKIKLKLKKKGIKDFVEIDINTPVLPVSFFSWFIRCTQNYRKSNQLLIKLYTFFNSYWSFFS